jgi:predicted dinucleotide-binding enzyme
MKKTFGIIGAGNIGQSMALQLTKAGYPVILGNTRGPESLKAIVEKLGARAKAGTLKEAAGADIVLLAIPWLALDSLKELTDWNGKLVVDSTNQYLSMDPLKLADLGDQASSEVVAGLLPGARIVKAFNTLWFKILAENPREAGGNRVAFYAGDDAAAKTEIAAIIEELGFAAVDIGTLHASKLTEQNGLLGHVNLIRLAYDYNPDQEYK